MGFWGLLTIVIIAYSLYSGSQKRAAAMTQLQAVQRREELATWEHDASTEFMHMSWEAHFPTMRMKYRAYTTDGPGFDSTWHYHQKRTKKGNWKIKYMWETCQEVMKEIEDDLKNPNYIGKSDRQERHEELKNGPIWERLDDAKSTSIEAAFQRYTHQG